MHGESRETLTTFFSSGTKRLLTFFKFLVFDTRRERPNFYYADCSIGPNNARPKLHWPRPISKINSLHPASDLN